MDAQTAVEFDRMKRRMEQIESENKELRKQWEIQSTHKQENPSVAENQETVGEQKSQSEQTKEEQKTESKEQLKEPEKNVKDGGILETPASETKPTEQTAEVVEATPEQTEQTKRRNPWGRSRT